MSNYFDNQRMNCISCQCKSPLFHFLSDEELALIQQNRTNVIFRPGETIRKQGTVMTHVLSLSSGLAKLYLEGIDQRNVILRFVQPTNFIGGPGIYLDLMHHYTITALIESSVCFIDIQVFKNIIKKNVSFAEEFMKDFSKNTVSVYDRLINLTQKQMAGRMADTLLYLFNDIFQGNKFPDLVSKQDLADLSAMSKNSGVKILREFQNEGIIRFTDHEMELLNLEALKKISKIG
jgi:CRP/FNR family transcriptional regulator, polysaccharide utilization system transcription regulator